MTILLWINLVLSITMFILYGILLIVGLKTSNKAEIKKDWLVYLVFALPPTLSMIYIFISTYFLFFEF